MATASAANAAAAAGGATLVGNGQVSNTNINLDLPGAAATQGQRYSTATSQLNNLLNQASTSTGPQEISYALVANANGDYPVAAGGNPVYLNQGDVWKYGTTGDPNGRYPQSYLDNIGSTGVTMVPTGTGTYYQTLVQEKTNLIFYFITNGSLPPGNLIFK